jgi:hypothetical protein
MRLQANGQRATGLTPANFDLQYTRSGAAAAAKVDATLNGNGVGGAHSDNTVIEVDATDSPGKYRIDWPDAAFATGVGEVTLTVKVATAFVEDLRVELGPPVNIVQINGDATDGNNATLSLKQLSINNNSGSAIDLDATGAPVIHITSSGIEHAVVIASPGGNGLDISGNDHGVAISGSIQTGVQINGTTFGIDIGASAGSGVRVAGTENDILSNITGTVSGNATTEQADRNADLIESHRGFHTWQGNYFYVDPVNGNDSTGDGSRALPYATIQACHDDLVTDSNHDVIFLVAGAASGVTTHTVAATTTISKRYTFIRGPGRDVVITRTGNGPTFDLTGDGVELSGFQLASPGASATSSGIDITDADYARIHDLWVLDTQGDGINILRGSNCQIHDNHFSNTGIADSAQAIHISGAGPGIASDNRIERNHISNTGGTSILIENGTTNDTVIQGNQIHNAGDWAIDIGASSTDAFVHDNDFGNNTTGDIQDNGTDSIILNNYDVVDGILDEVNTAATHNVPTSVGRQIRQISSNVLGPFTVASATANTISLDADGDLSEVDGSYDPSRIFVDSGTGEDQPGKVMEYFGQAGNGNPARTLILREDMKVTLDDTSAIFIIISDGRASTNQGQLRGGTTTTATLNALAPGADVSGQTLHFTAGTGQDQVALVESYSDPVATFQALDVAVDATTSYELLPAGCVNVEMIGKSSQSAVDFKDFVDAGYDPATSKVEGVKLVDTTTDVTNGVTVALIATDAITADALAASAVTEIATGTWTFVIETGLTAQESMTLANAANAGKLTGAGTTEVKIRDAADTKDRITMSVDASGNRTIRTLDLG